MAKPIKLNRKPLQRNRENGHEPHTQLGTRRLQAQFQKLSEERKKFLAEEEKKNAAKGPDTLQDAMLKAIREEAEKKNFKFE